MKTYIVSIPLVGAAPFEVQARTPSEAKEKAWEAYNDAPVDDFDVEWELVEAITTGNVLHASLNEISVNEVKAKKGTPVNLIEQAKSLATQQHVLEKHQLYGLLPYTHHLQAVEEELIAFGFGGDEELRAAAWLHDIVEDTSIKVRDIEERFGEDVAVLVAAVTSEEGENRKVRNALTYPKIRAAGVRAVALKLADRIVNVGNGGAHVKMYQKEHPDFKHGIYLPMWAENATPSASEAEVYGRVLRMQACLDEEIANVSTT